MCIFSGPADALRSVSATSIFARPVADERQILVYSMTVAANEPIAMVLPLPVPARSAEDALRFINLQSYPLFFEDLDRAFPPPPAAQWLNLEAAAVAGLAVHEVGDFVASFVPSRADFGRLDERFRLSDDVWSALPDYADWGFAVFQLATHHRASETIHPMAFEFPLRDPSRIFFPTVHVHDGAVHETAEFDHTLYAQLAPGQTLDGWFVSLGPLHTFVDTKRAAGVVEASKPCFKTQLRGVMPNKDIYATAQKAT